MPLWLYLLYMLNCIQQLFIIHNQKYKAPEARHPPCPLRLSCEVLGFIISPLSVLLRGEPALESGQKRLSLSILFVVPCIKLFWKVDFIRLLVLSRDLKWKWLCPLRKRHWEIHFSDRLRHYPCLWATFNIALSTKGFSFGFCGAFFLVVCLIVLGFLNYLEYFTAVKRLICRAKWNSFILCMLFMIAVIYICWKTGTIISLELC